jgi:hypothetical protein
MKRRGAPSKDRSVANRYNLLKAIRTREPLPTTCERCGGRMFHTTDEATCMNCGEHVFAGEER